MKCSMKLTQEVVAHVESSIYRLTFFSSNFSLISYNSCYLYYTSDEARRPIEEQKLFDLISNEIYFASRKFRKWIARESGFRF